MHTIPSVQRPAFFASLHRYIAACREDGGTLGLLLIDIDNIDQVNHQHGYEHGDTVLAQCYGRLLSVSKMSETVFRVGGQRFVFILPALPNPSLIALALNKISHLLSEEICVAEAEIRLKIKIGVAVNKSASLCPEKTLMKAEKSLKEVKNSGETYVLSSAEVDSQEEEFLERVFMEDLSANNFELHYQPKIDMATGEVNRAEALLRWLVGEHGYVSPEVAVAIAERNGQSFNLTRWVVNTAVRQVKEWEKQGRVMNVAVNVPAGLVHSPELLTMVQDSLAIWGVSKERLTMEITESAIIEDKEAGFDNLMKFKKYGVKLSIDDFGTGYSSLSYFKQIPAHELKIDKSFVAGMLSDEQDQYLVRIIINMARLFRLQVVAEGIEDQETYDFLKKLGCHFGQGYHIARPMPAENFIAWLDQHVIAA